MRRTTLPAAVLCAAGVVVVPSAAYGQDTPGCADVTPSEAQQQLDTNPADPNGFDPDNDGIACEPGEGVPAPSGPPPAGGRPPMEPPGWTPPVGSEEQRQQFVTNIDAKGGLSTGSRDEWWQWGQRVCAALDAGAIPDGLAYGLMNTYSVTREDVSLLMEVTPPIACPQHTGTTLAEQGGPPPGAGVPPAGPPAEQPPAGVPVPGQPRGEGPPMEAPPEGDGWVPETGAGVDTGDNDDRVPDTGAGVDTGGW